MQPGELIASDLGARAARGDDLARAWEVLEQVMDPEVPVVSVVDLGIVRDLDWRAGHLHLVVTPTYSGCPATEVIEAGAAADPGLEHRLDQRAGPPTLARLRHRTARGQHQQAQFAR